MRTKFLLIVLAGLCCSAAFLVQSEPKIYPYRWVRLNVALSDDRDLEKVRQIARTASEHGLNGILLSAGLDQLDLKPAAYQDTSGRGQTHLRREQARHHPRDLLNGLRGVASRARQESGGRIAGQGRTVPRSRAGSQARRRIRLCSVANGGFEEPGADRLDGL